MANLEAFLFDAMFYKNQRKRQRERKGGAMAKARSRALAESYKGKEAKTTLNTFKGIKGLKVKTIYDGLYIRPNCAKGMITPIDDWVGVDEDGNRVMLSEVKSDNNKTTI